MTVRRAGGPDPDFPRPSVQTSSSLTAANSALTIDVTGLQGVYAAFDDQSNMTAALGMRVLNSKNTNEYRFFWDGNKWCGTANFPNGTGTGEQGVTFSLPLEMGDQQAAVFLWGYTSGSANVTLTAHDRLPYEAYAPSLGIDGGNPSGFTSESPGSLSIGGKDPVTPRIHRTASFDSGGRAIVRPWGPIDWSTGTIAAANQAAIVTKAAGGAGVRHICTSIAGAIVSNNTIAPAAASSTVLALRDGPSTAGTIVWALQLSLPATAGATTSFGISGLNIRGSANTNMCLEFLTASGLSTLQSASITGVSLVDG